MKKTAIITGGSGGIGAAIAKRLCKEGFITAIIYLNSEEKAFTLSSELVSEGYNAFPIKADAANPIQVKNAVETAAKQTGKIDVLINNAGVSLYKLLQDTTDEEWNRVIDINLKGAFNFCREVLPYMIREGFGRIINISSMWGQTGAAMETVYSASKAGLIGLTKALAKEVALSGITVNCIAPGAVDTPMMALFSEDEKKTLCDEIPIGRLSSPEETASAAAFLASEESSYITGQVIGVNGGFVI
ncbi:MAG: 3-oxoacyl-ACP reductase FabG [Oscillospiraceae bacterium]|nr:3-oxoacyl-ACP reductase FabG [Oscillospiraceae bacterium]